MTAPRDSSKRVLVFDFFGVICSEVAPYWLARYFSPAEAVRIKQDLVAQADEGTVSQDQLFRLLGELTGLSKEQVRDEWLQYVKIDKQVVALVESLAEDVRLALLTNAPAPFVRSILDEHGLPRLFEEVVVSSEEGVAKPDPRIYQVLLDRLGVPAGDAIMIDDNLLNVEGAKAVNMQGIHFSTNEKSGVKFP